MKKAPQFYKRYIVAVFRRGKADRLPLQYILGEAKRVLKPEEMEKLQPTLDELVAQGNLEREGEFLILKNPDIG
jgi:hypothetical protein